MLGSRHWGYEVSGPESHASCNQSALGEPFEGLPQLGGSCDDQRLHLVDGPSLGLESRVLRGLQHADHLNLVHARLWSGMGYPGKHSTGSRLGVRWVTLPYPPICRDVKSDSICECTLHQGEYTRRYTPKGITPVVLAPNTWPHIRPGAHAPTYRPAHTTLHVHAPTLARIHRRTPMDGVRKAEGG